MQDVYAFSHATANIIFLCTLAFIGLLALASLREVYVELDEFKNMDKLT